MPFYRVLAGRLGLLTLFLALAACAEPRQSETQH